MLKKSCFVLFATVVLAQSAFAELTADEKACAPIVKACLDAGFGNDNQPKQFWADCMEPVILGKKVDKVEVSDDVVKTCRTTKIREIKEELVKLEQANS